MGTKKKQSTSAKRTASGKVRPTKKHARKGRAPEKLANRAAAPNKPVQKRKGLKKTISGKAASVDNKQTRKKNQGRSSLAFSISGVSLVRKAVWLPDMDSNLG
jgi:hypothetical protein